ncbi:MAG: rRNA maturation RNase YbeY [Pseudomonadota bacterium]
MMVGIDVLRVSGCDSPNDERFQQATALALRLTGRSSTRQTEISFRVIDEEEMRDLNGRFRGKDSPTNVLAFPAELTVETDLGVELLGDIAICAPIVRREAMQQGKSVESHWDHLVIHGVLHLAGFDHDEEESATKMEALETIAMRELGWPDPYDPASWDSSDAAAKPGAVA